MENNDVLVATNVAASQLLERRPTGTLHARANSFDKVNTTTKQGWAELVQDHQIN